MVREQEGQTLLLSRKYLSKLCIIDMALLGVASVVEKGKAKGKISQDLKPDTVYLWMQKEVEVALTENALESASYKNPKIPK